MPPPLVAMMPSALLPVPVQMDFHLCPAAMTPGISLTMYSLGIGGPAAALAPRPAPPPSPRAAPPAPAAPAPGAPPAAAPRAAPPPRGAGGFLQFLAT